MEELTITELQQLAYAIGYRAKEEGKTFEEGIKELLKAIDKANDQIKHCAECGLMKMSHTKEMHNFIPLKYKLFRP